jgi:hypothetical protein
MASACHWKSLWSGPCIASAISRSAIRCSFGASLHLPRRDSFLPGNLQLGTDPTVIGNLAGELSRYLATGIDGFFIDQPILGVQIRDAGRDRN